MKKHTSRDYPLEPHEEQAVKEELPRSIAEVVLCFGKSGRVLTQSELPLIVLVVRKVLSAEALRTREPAP